MIVQAPSSQLQLQQPLLLHAQTKLLKLEMATGQAVGAPVALVLQTSCSELCANASANSEP